MEIRQKNIKTDLLSDLAISLLCIHSKEIKTAQQSGTCPGMLTVLLLLVAKILNEPGGLLVNE